MATSKAKRAGEVIDLIAEGRCWVEVRCDQCRATRYVPFRLLGRIDLSWTVPELARRLLCETCGTPADPTTVKAVNMLDGQPKITKL